MGQTPRGALFYGIRVDTGSYPDRVNDLSDVADLSNAVAGHLLLEAGYDIDRNRSFSWGEELEDKTGIALVDLEDEGMYLAVQDTLHRSSGWNGAQKIDIPPIGMEDVLKLEQYAKRLGVEQRLGDWFFWTDFR